MNNSKKASPSKEDKVAESTSAAYNQSVNTQPDKGKSQAEDEKQSEKDAKSTSVAPNENHTQSVNKQSDKGKSQAEDEKQSEKVAESTSAAPNQNHTQSGNTQPDNDSSSTQVDTQHYATKVNLRVVNKKTDEKFATIGKLVYCSEEEQMAKPSKGGVYELFAMKTLLSNTIVETSDIERLKLCSN